MKKLEEDPEWWSLMRLFCETKNEKVMNELMHLFLTMAERETLVGRYRIVKALLTTEQPQREISEKLGQSITKITHGSKALQVIPEELRKFLIKALKEKGHKK